MAKKRKKKVGWICKLCCKMASEHRIMILLVACNEERHELNLNESTRFILRLF